jgi:hypothetical protein
MRTPNSPPWGFEGLTMRVFLRNRQTRLYCAAADRWTVVLAEAFAFSDIQHATRFALDQKLPEVEIVVRCDLVDQEVAMPLLPEWYKPPCVVASKDELAA